MTTRTHTGLRFDLPLLALRGTVALRLSDLFALAHQRRQLAGLDDERLLDLGLTRNDARREAARSVWDVPSHWIE